MAELLTIWKGLVSFSPRNGEKAGDEGLDIIYCNSHSSRVNLKQIARALRRNQTGEEKELWRALRGRQFAGFKFRRQYVVAGYVLDFYCADAKLAVELDGGQHGLPGKIQQDEGREKCLAEQGIDTIRFWNHQWRQNRDGCLLDIWNAVRQRTGCVRIMANADEQKYIPPDVGQIKINE